MTRDDAQRSLNVNEEYLGALKTKSYGDFFTKAQFLVNEPTSPSQVMPQYILRNPP